MASRVWVYPERTWQKLGDVRWQISWEEVKPSAQGNDEIDPDSDILYRYAAFLDHDSAVKKAEEIVESGETAFGAVTVQKQVVDWFVEEDRVAEWRDAGESEEITS